MKKQALILILFIAAFSSVHAQKGKVTAAMNYLTNKEVEKAWTTIQEAEQNEKTANYSKTFYAKGKVLQAMAESQDEKIQKLVEDPLPKAYEAYKKAMALDEKHKIDKSIDIQLPMLNNDFINLGVKKFQAKDFPGAIEAFETSLEIGKSKIFGGMVDTSIVFNAGLAAYNGKMWDKAIQYFKQAKDLQYGGTNVYQLMNVVYLTQGDSANAENILREGVEKNPENESILLSLLQYFLNTGKDKQAWDYLSAAKAKSPDDKVLWYVEGLLYDRAEDRDNALESYKKAIEIDPKYYDPYYNAGVILFNKGANLYNEANQIMDNEKFQAAKKEADEVFGSAIPYFEKALDADNITNANKRDCMENLKILYYRLKMMDKREEIIKKLEELDQEKK